MKNARIVARSRRGRKNDQNGCFVASGSFLIEFTIERSIAKISSAQTIAKPSTAHMFPAKVKPVTQAVKNANTVVIRIIMPMLAWRLYSFSHCFSTEISEPEMTQKKY